jgi:hypothetical protein
VSPSPATNEFLEVAAEVRLPSAAAPISVLQHLLIGDENERQNLVVAGAHGLFVNFVILRLPPIKPDVGADLPRDGVCNSARGLDADRHRNGVTSLDAAGSQLEADLQLSSAGWRPLP